MTLKISAENLFPPVKKALRSVRDELAALRAGVLSSSVTYNAGSLVDAAGETTTVYVPGAEIGDIAMAALGVSTQGIVVTAFISAPDVVSVRLQNETGGTLDLASTTLRVLVVPRRNIPHAFGPHALFGSGTVDVASLVDAAGATGSITVTGAALGDFAFAAHGVNTSGMSVAAYVQAANTVEVRFQNESGGTLDLASTTLRAVVVPAAYVAEMFDGHVKSGSATYDASSLADGAGETTTVTVPGASVGDFAVASHGVDAADLVVTAAVTADNTVSVRVQNESAGTVNLASATLRAAVIPASYIDRATVLSITK